MRLLPTQIETNYTESLDLDNEVFLFKFTWNKIYSDWSLDLSDSQGNVLAKGMRLTPGAFTIIGGQISNDLFPGAVLVRAAQTPNRFDFDATEAYLVYIPQDELTESDFASIPLDEVKTQALLGVAPKPTSFTLSATEADSEILSVLVTLTLSIAAEDAETLSVLLAAGQSIAAAELGDNTISVLFQAEGSTATFTVTELGDNVISVLHPQSITITVADAEILSVIGTSPSLFNITAASGEILGVLLSLEITAADSEILSVLL